MLWTSVCHGSRNLETGQQGKPQKPQKTWGYFAFEAMQLIVLTVRVTLHKK
jgi:hypothetical protein